MEPTPSADFWGIGILTYEMIVGFPPFYTGNKQNSTLFDNIKEKEVYLDVEQHGITMSPECTDFIKNLLQKDPTKRLGYADGAAALIQHPWLSELDCDKISNMKVQAPYVPELDDDMLDTSNFDSKLTAEEAVETVLCDKGLKKVEKYVNVLNNF